MFRDEQNILGYWHINGMAKVVKPIIMANAVYQGLQGSYLSIRYLFFQNPVNQMYALTCCIKFIRNAILMNSMK